MIESALVEEYKQDNKICAGWLLWVEERKEKFNQHVQDVLAHRTDIAEKITSYAEIHPSELGCVLVTKRGEKGKKYVQWEQTVGMAAINQGQIQHQSIGHWTPSGSPDRNISDTTGDRAISMASLVEELLAEREELLKWVMLIRDVEAGLPWKQLTFLKLRREYRFRRGRNGWVAPVQHKYCEAVARKEKKRVEDVWINDRNTFSDWWRLIVEYTARNAAKRNLL